MNRAMFAFELMCDSHGGGCILFPVAFTEKGLSGYMTHEGEAFGKVLSVVELISRCGKTPLVFANSERFSRSLPSLINMIDKIHVLGGGVVTASQYGAENEWPRVLWAYSEWQTSCSEIAEDSTHINPCNKNDGRSAAVNRRQRDAARSNAEEILKPGTGLNRFVVDATSAGLGLLAENATVIEGISGILNEDLKSLQGPSSQLADIKKKAERAVQDLTKRAQPGKSDNGCKSIIIFLTRTSPGSTCHVFEATEGADCVSASQMGWNVSPDVKESIDGFDNHQHIILPEHHKHRRKKAIHHENRRSDTIDAFSATVALVLCKNVSAVVVTTSTRASGHLGYIVFLERLCELTKTKLIFSQHMGGNKSNEEVAIAEQDRYDAKKGAHQRYLAVCEGICKRESLHPKMKKIAATTFRNNMFTQGDEADYCENDDNEYEGDDCY